MNEFEKKFSDSRYIFGHEEERSFKIYLRKLIKSNNLKILDIGCGKGLNSINFMNKNDVTGIDISEEAIKKYKLINKKCHVADVIEGIPFENETFDLVFCSEVIEHNVDTSKFLNEVNRILKKDGKLLLSTPNSSFWVYRILSLFGKTLTEIQHDGHVRFFSIKLIENFLINSGFKVQKTHSRIIYLIIPYNWSFLRFLGFHKEFRMKTNSYFWYFGKCKDKFSNFFSDTIIIESKKN
jgi:2-polyprenyl-3-methyl-5-hydroxy-6-metoxy-1,4-benzoquinol methylase